MPSQVNEIIPAQRQRDALNAALDTLDAKELVYSGTDILKLIAAGSPLATTQAAPELFSKRRRPPFLTRSARRRSLQTSRSTDCSSRAGPRE